MAITIVNGEAKVRLDTQNNYGIGANLRQILTHIETGGYYHDPNFRYSATV
jgi:hypothetical protein